MFKIIFFIVSFLIFEKLHVVSADCNRFVPTPIWNFTELLSSWTVRGLVDLSPPSPTLRYVEMGSRWNSFDGRNDTFDIWTYGTMVEPNGQELVFDGWYFAQRLDANRPGELVQSHELGGEITSNTTILYFDNETILWVNCYLDGTGEERNSQAVMGTKSGSSLSDSQKEQFKSILKFNYGMDVDNNYVNIPQEPFIGSSTTPTNSQCSAKSEFEIISFLAVVMTQIARLSSWH